MNSRSRRKPRNLAQAISLMEGLEPRKLLAATPLNPGQSVNGSLLTTGQQDVYTFNAGVNDSIRIHIGDTTTNGALYPHIIVDGPSGRVDSSWGYDGTWISFQVSAAGQYLVTASDYYSSVGSYRLTLGRYSVVQLADQDQQGGAIHPNQSATTGSITRGDLDIYWFDASAGDPFRLVLAETTSQSLTPSIELFRPDGSSHYWTYNSSAVTLDVASAPMSGRYYVQIFDYYFGSGSYSLSFTGVAQPSWTSLVNGTLSVTGTP